MFIGREDKINGLLAHITRYRLTVVLATSLACFIMEKLRILYGSPSSSMVMPVLISEVSTATMFTGLESRCRPCFDGAKACVDRAIEAMVSIEHSFIMGWAI